MPAPGMMPGMHQVTETAQQTQATSINTEGEIQATANGLQAATDECIPHHWRGMQQVDAFLRVEMKFQGIMQEILAAMRLLGDGTIASMGAYIDVDELHAADITAKTTDIDVGQLTRSI
jgi:hypothetical protein